ncbi:MAG: pyridoxamine 5'-phosphate oxidase family protein [Leptolyngbyaceae cyanobacterium CSU_1_3]|nr:pyridoxamine 5'-phosphate oxidase family protein [Leptolyngbyaceae cyanobacterium CSU_1_3]
MIDIDEMSSKEILELLQKVGYGHLGCIHEGKPYIIPMQYHLKDSVIYLFTTEGMKTQDIDANPAVCLQVEDVHDLEHWQSAIVTGEAERLKDQSEIDQIMQLVKARNPTLSPAINRTWIDAQGRAEVITIYCIHSTEMTGRMTSSESK